jgi:YHS domain-containing protein
MREKATQWSLETIGTNYFFASFSALYFIL